MTGWVPIVSFVLALGGTFWLQKNYVGPKDYPNERSLHVKPVPRTGGVAVVFAMAIGAMLGNYDEKLILVGLTVSLAAISFLDDLFHLPIVVRLAAHVFCVVAAINWLPSALNSWEFVLIALALTWLTNLYNFMDGADGLAAGMTGIGFSAYASAALLAGHSHFATLSFSISAAALGFLLFNFHPARIFLGDVGSISLGFLAGICGFYGWQAAIWPAWFPVLVFSPFIVDASLTLVKRLLRGEKIWQAHSQHYYQKLVHSGLGQRKMALFEYLLMLIVAITSVISLQLTPPWQTLFIAFWVSIYLILIFRLDKYFRTRHVKPAPPSI